MNRVFLDLDGVMADLEGDYLRHFGHTMSQAESRNKMWKNINDFDEWFFNMSVMEGAAEFFEKIKQYNPIVLTSCPETRYQQVADEKKRWVRKHLCKDILILPVCGSETKQYYVQNKGDILIDDYGKNCREWEAAGGIAIKHEGTDFESTYNRFIAAWHASRGLPSRSQGLDASCACAA